MIKFTRDNSRSFKLLGKKGSGEDSASKKQGKIKWKFIIRVLSKPERIIIYVAILAVLGALGWLGWDFSWQHIKTEPKGGGHYIEGTAGEPQYINPLYSQGSDTDMDITRLVFSSLMEYNRQQELVPDLAESYEVSEDEKNYTFHLRQNAYWHDGEQLTADDVVFTVQTIKNPSYQSVLLGNFQDVAIEKVDDFTVKFTLTGESLSPFLKENTTFGIIPKHIWQEIIPANVLLTEYNLSPVGSGPYVFSEYKKDKRSGIIDSYTLVKNNNYHQESPFIDKITFKFFDDYATAVNSYNAGEINGISYLPPEEKENISKKAQENITTYNLKLPRYYALFFNQPKNSLLKSKEVRKALAYGTNREEIITQIFNGEGVRIDSPILESFLGHNPDSKKYEYDKDQANNILNEDDWDDINEEGYRHDGDTILEFTITTTDQEEFYKLAELLQKQWKEIGVKVNIEPIDPTELQTEYIKPRNYEILLYGQLIGHDPDPYSFWHSTQRQDPGLNLTSFKDSTADDLLETARKTSKEEERIKKYLHWQNIITEELPALFLCSPTYAYAVDKSVQGIELEYITVPSDRFANVTNWYMEISYKWEW
ncbi:MAG: ABC transporter substrate-binding protein [Parcubacteria group bacterium]